MDSPKKQRLLFIDIVRGLAVLTMIQAHVSNSTILNSIRKTPQFHNLDLLNGFVSATFIFIAGFSLCLVLERKLAAFLKFEKPLWTQIQRLLFILAIGYWLHLPLWSLRKILNMNDQQIFAVFRCDVLHAIALSLLFCILLGIILRKQRFIALTTAVLGLFVVFWTPFLYDTDPNTYVSPVIGTYITAHHNPLFPLFPSSAYAFAGYFFCWVYLQCREKNKERLLFSILLICGLIMLVGAFALFHVSWSYHTYADPSKSSPRHFMMKMGAVFLVLSGCWFYEHIRKPARSIINIVGQESLFVYGFHLMIVYGCVFTPHNFAHDIGNSLTYLASFGLAAVLILLMSIAAIVWHHLKTSYPKVAKGIFYGVVAIWVIGLLVN